jgi:hypothetical protein
LILHSARPSPVAVWRAAVIKSNSLLALSLAMSSSVQP